jgi:serine/threonine protein kinase
MSYCLNPKCPKPNEPLNNSYLCCRCGSPLVLQNRYRVTRLLGEGSFSKIYEVEDCPEVRREPEPRQVLKVLLVNDAIAVSLFRQEARVLSQLRHPGIPQVSLDGYFTFFAKDRHQPLHCLVMEKVAGVNLEQWQQENQPLSQAQAINWLRQLLETLHHIHQQLYFHRDIKPANIMLTPSGQLVLINFGSAREVSHSSLVKASSGELIEMTSTGYTPLEQANGKAVPQSDFFALGRSFVALLTGKSPSNFLEDPRNGQLLWQHRAPQLTSAFTDLIDDLMAPMPVNRPHNAQIILQRLAVIDHAWQAPQPMLGLPEFTESLLSLRLEAWIRQQKSSSHLKRVAKKFGKFQKPLLIGGILCSLGLAGTQLPRLSSFKEPFSALSNNPWVPLKK